jgi:WD40 repeat protein
VLLAGLGLVALGTALPMPSSTRDGGRQTVVLPAGSGTAVAFSPFGAFAAGSLATGGPGARMVVRDGHRGGSLRVVDTADDRLTVLAADPLNRNIMATGGTIGVVRFWDTSTGRPTNSLRVQPAGPRLTLAFNCRRRGVLAVGGAAGVVTVWDSKNDQVRRLPTALGDVTALAFDPFNEPFLAVGGRAGVELWDVDTQQRLHRFQQVAGTVTALAFDPLTRNTLAIATAREPAGIWDSSSGATVRALGDSAGVTALDFNPMIRNSLAAGDARGRVRIWDTSNGLVIHGLATGGRRVTGLDYAVDGETLAVAADDGVVRLHPVRDW